MSPVGPDAVDVAAAPLFDPHPVVICGWVVQQGRFRWLQLQLTLYLGELEIEAILEASGNAGVVGT